LGIHYFTLRGASEKEADGMGEQYPRVAELPRPFWDTDVMKYCTQM